jgi:hypothetical protein
VIQFSQMAACVGLDCIADNRIRLDGRGPVIRYLRTFSSSTDMTYGAVVLDAAGQRLEAYTLSTPTTTPEAAIITTGMSQIVHASAAGTTVCGPGRPHPCDERWGDYLGAAPDPTHPSKVWLAGLYQSASGGEGFATVITSVKVG